MFAHVGRPVHPFTRLVVLLGLVLAGLGVVLPASRALAAPTHTLVDVGRFDGREAMPRDANSHGDFVANVTEADGSNRAVLWRGGRTTQLARPAGYTLYFASGLNDHGQVVGDAYGPRGRVPLLWDNGTVTELESIAGSDSIAWDINNRGQIAGTIADSVVLWENGRIVKQTAALSGPFATAINEQGQVVGQTGEGAFVWDGTTYTALPDLPGSFFNAARDINEHGQIVGVSNTEGVGLQAVLWQNGSVAVLPVPTDMDSVEAHSINDQGQIVGDAFGRPVLWQDGGVVELTRYADDLYAFAWSINNRGQIAGWGRGGTVYGDANHVLLWNPNANATVLSNGGFETDADGNGKADDWSAAALASRSSAAKRSGSAGLRLQSTANRDFQVFQPVYGVRPNAAYDVGGWVNIPRTSDQFTFSIAVAWKDKLGTELRVDTVRRWSGTTSGWNQGITRLTAPPNTDRAVVRVSVTSLAATVYVDDVVFQTR